MTELVSDRPRGASSAPSIVVGVLAIAVFFGLAFAFGDWFFLAGAALGVVGVALGLRARTVAPDRSERRRATFGIVLGAVPLVWFVAYMVVTAIADRV
jgi:hypothetical protein